MYETAVTLKVVFTTGIWICWPSQYIRYSRPALQTAELFVNTTEVVKNMSVQNFVKIARRFIRYHVDSDNRPTTQHYRS